MSPDADFAQVVNGFSPRQREMYGEILKTFGAFHDEFEKRCYEDSEDEYPFCHELFMNRLNWPDRTPGLAREAWRYPQAQAYFGRVSTDRGDHRTARRRRWSTDEKVRMVEDSFESGESSPWWRAGMAPRPTCYIVGAG